MNLSSLTDHAHRVHAFMLRAKQTTPTVPTMPDEKTRLLRAKLIIEEALETVHALGIRAFAPTGVHDEVVPIDNSNLQFQATHEPDLVEIVDGCCDVSVVTIGTLLSCGVEDKPMLELVDRVNLGKFGPGHWFREDGKLMKSPDFVAPDVASALKEQGWKTSNPAGKSSE